jgi:hypothetical protein
MTSLQYCIAAMREASVLLDIPSIENVRKAQGMLERALREAGNDAGENVPVFLKKQAD